MAETGNYQLKQWEKTDRIQMEDFNADNAKTDQALGSLAATVAGCGNCEIVYGSYTGSGTYGKTAPNSLSFLHKPLLIYVQSSTAETDADCKLRMVRGITWAVGAHGNSSWTNSVTWSEKSVQWSTSRSASTQFNTSGVVYHYIAFLAADE